MSATPEQIDETLEPTVDDLRRLNAQAEPGAWWVDDFKVDDGFGQHYAYALANPMGKHIADTINGDLILIEQDDGPRRDMAGSRNLEFAAACVNYVRNVVLKADLATSGAQAERVRVLEGLLQRLEPSIGWRSATGTSRDFACEFCHQTHEHFAHIEHTDACPVTQVRAALKAAP